MAKIVPFYTVWYSSTWPELQIDPSFLNKNKKSIDGLPLGFTVDAPSEEDMWEMTLNGYAPNMPTVKESIDLQNKLGNDDFIKFLDESYIFFLTH